MKDPIPAAAHPCEGYVIEVGGEFNSEYGSITAALKAGFELRRKDGGHEVRVYDAQERTPETREPPEFHWWMTLADPSQCA